MNVVEFIAWLDANGFRQKYTDQGTAAYNGDNKKYTVVDTKESRRFYFYVGRCEFGPIIYDQDTKEWRWWCAKDDTRFFDEDPRELLNKALPEQWVLAQQAVEQAMEQRSQIYKVLQQTRT